MLNRITNRLTYQVNYRVDYFKPESLHKKISLSDNSYVNYNLPVKFQCLVYKARPIESYKLDSQWQWK